VVININAVIGGIKHQWVRFLVLLVVVLCIAGALDQFLKYKERPLYQRVEYLGKVDTCVQRKGILFFPVYDITLNGSSVVSRHPFMKGSKAYVVTHRNGYHSIYSYNPLDELESAAE